MNKNKVKMVSLFFEKFGLMITSGVPLVASLRKMEKDCKDEKFTKIISGIAEGVIGGKIFHECLGPLELSESEMALIIAGEKNGELDMVTLRVARLIAIRMEMQELKFD